jgi:hypothetical protein
MKNNVICFLIKIKSFFGYNKNLNKCALGFKMEHYHGGGAFIEPVIFNIDQHSYCVDFKRMGYNEEQAEEYKLLNYYGRYKILVNITYAFCDSENYYQYIFHRKNLYNDTNSALLFNDLERVGFP